MTSPLRSASSTKARAASFLQRVGGLEEAGGDLLGQDVGLGQDEGVLNVAHDGVEAGQGLDDGAFATRDLDDGGGDAHAPHGFGQAIVVGEYDDPAVLRVRIDPLQSGHELSVVETRVYR